MTLTDRILAVLDHLRLERVHVATQAPGDVQDLVANHPDRVGGIALVAPPRIDPAPFAAYGSEVLYVVPEGGMLAKTAARTLPRLPNARPAHLSGYDAESWSDLALDRPDLVELFGHYFAGGPQVDHADGSEQSGDVEGVRFRAIGSGPVLIVTPMVLAPSQWQPLLPRLSQHFRVVELAGPHFGMLALLEERAALDDWQHMCAGLFDALELQPGHRVLDVGCGSGAVARQFLRHSAGKNPLTAMDLSPYLLSEAQVALETAEHCASVNFEEGSAEQLPFDDQSFDAAYSITVLEECNAQRAISELKRVVKPGGRIAIVVRGIDLHQWWNLPLSDDLRAKISLPAPSIAPAGVASAALYDLATDAGLKPVRMFTCSVASEGRTGPIFDYPEMYAMSLLSDDERAAYRNAKAKAVAAGTLFMTRGHHCFVGEVV